VTIPGEGGLPKVVLADAAGSRAEVYLHGAHVTSWIPAGGAEWLFVSGRSAFRAGTAIRGGIPVIFPQFASRGELPKHGFARNVAWELVSASDAASTAGPSGDAAAATFRLRNSESTRELWPHAFVAELTVTVAGPTLDVALAVVNSGVEPLVFTGALHSYFRVDDVRGARVEGLGGVRYSDSAAGGEERTDAAPALGIAAETDRIYLDAPDHVRLVDGARALEIHSRGFPDTVVWNPWAERTTALVDMEPDGYLRMLCVEAAVVGRPVHLEPGARWSGRQTLTAP